VLKLEEILNEKAVGKKFYNENFEGQGYFEVVAVSPLQGFQLKGYYLNQKDGKHHPFPVVIHSTLLDGFYTKED